LFVFVVPAYLRRRVLHFAGTEHPTSAWTARQVTEAFPWDTAPRYGSTTETAFAATCSVGE
jgi:hypothetical protein